MCHHCNNSNLMSFSSSAKQIVLFIFLTVHYYIMLVMFFYESHAHHREQRACCLTWTHHMNSHEILLDNLIDLCRRKQHNTTKWASKININISKLSNKWKNLIIHGPVYAGMRANGIEPQNHGSKWPATPVVQKKKYDLLDVSHKLLLLSVEFSVVCLLFSVAIMKCWGPVWSNWASSNKWSALP